MSLPYYVPDYIREEHEEYQQKKKEKEAASRKRKEDRFHMAALKYTRTARNPERLVDIYASNPNLYQGPGEGWRSPIVSWSDGAAAAWGALHSEETQAKLADAAADYWAQRAAQFVDTYERAYLRHEGKIPMTWWVAQEPEDVRLLSEEFPQFGDQFDTIADYIYAVGQQTQAIREREEEINAEIQRRYDAELRSRGFAGTMGRSAGTIFGWLGDVVTFNFAKGDQRVQTFVREQGMTDEEIRAEVERQVREEFRLGAAPPEVEANLIERAAMDAIGAIGWVFDKTGQYVIDPSMRGMGWVSEQVGYNYYDLAVQAFEDEKEEQIAQLKRQRELAAPKILEQYKYMAAEEAWLYLQQEAPEEYETYINMAGGDMVLAQGFFQADIQEELEASEQLQLLLEQDEEDFQAYIATLEERDYRPSADLMEVLAAYGTHVPMRLATAATLLLTDDDVLQDSVLGKWETLWSEIERNEFSPAKALGLDNTAVGLMLDLGAGIAFDPTTWIFGPRATAMAGRASNAAQITKMARSPLVTRTIRDLRRIRSSPAHGAMEAAFVGSWLDEVGMLGPALEHMGIRVEKKLPASPWKQADARAPYTQEIPLSTVRRLMDDADIERLNEVRGQVVDDIAESLKKDGFHNAIELEYSLHDGTFHFSDGGKRILAADKLDLETVPVTVRIRTSRRADRMPRIGDLDPIDVQHIADLATGRIKASQAGTSPRLQPTFEEMAGIPRDLQGLTGYQPIGEITSKSGKTFELRRYEEMGPPDIQGDPSRIYSYYVVDDQGRVIAGATVDEANTLAVWTHPDHRGQGLMNGVFDAARANGDELLLASGTSGDLSVAGQLNAQAQARRFFESHGIDIDSLPGPMGVRLEDVIDKSKGEKIPRHSKKADDYKPNVEGQVYVRPEKLIPERMIYGEFNEAALRKVIEEALGRGATMPSATRLVTAMGWSNSLRASLRRFGGRPGRWLERYMSPQNKVTRLELHGPTATAQINETIVRIWGQNTERLNFWLERVMDQIEAETATQSRFLDELSEINNLRHQRDALDDLLGGGWDDAYRQMQADEMFFEEAIQGVSDEAVLSSTDELNRIREQMAQARENRNQTRAMRDELENEFVTRLARLDAEMALQTRNGLASLIEEMFDDYNRTHIATNPAWKGKVDPETGMVPWEELKKGRPRPEREGKEGVRRILSDEQLEAARRAEIENPEELARHLNAMAHVKTGVELPLSPLDMVIASEVGGAAYTRLTQASLAHGVREGARWFNLWWIVDKVLSPATAITVSWDELSRIFHWGGTEAVMRWAGDKAMLGAARAAAVLHGKKPVVHKGAQYLPRRAQERIRALTDYPTHLKQAERQAFEGMGMGWDDIAPGDPGYADAARRWVGNWLQDTGFRAFLRGKDAYREWFFGADGQRLRQATVLEGGASRLVKGWEEAYQGMQTVVDIMLHRAGPEKRRVIDALRETAERIDAAGGRAIEPPGWILEHLGTIRGVRKEAPTKHGITALTDSYFDTMLMSPVNYRRGMIAELVRKHETRRLENLFESQRLKIVPDTEIERMLNLQGLGGATAHGPMRRLLQERAFQQGYVTRGYIDDLVEFRVASEIDNILFTWDMGSRMGKQSQIIFPFGRPWADMMGFWGREVLSRPALRGWLNNTPILGDIANAAADRLAFNPKPLAMISRLAATDFSFEKLAPGVGLPFGAEEADFSPLLFLPTGGDNPFASLIPGLGILPLWIIDRVIQDRFDPVDNPVEYQELVDAVGDFIPSVAYQRGGVLGRLLGGGTTGAATEVITDVFGATGGRPFFNVTSELGDIGREINRSRELSALMADPEEIEALLSLTDPEAVRMHLEGIAHEANRRASAAHGAETLLRKSMPASWEFDESLDQIHNVWIDTAKDYGGVLGLPQEWKAADPNDAEAVRQQADDIRRAFFGLEQWQRDMLIAQKPEIAVNLVSSWEYTPLGIADLGVETSTAYRTDGTRESRARHQLYVDKGYIRPVEPITRALRILGLQQASRESLAKEVYTRTAAQVNDALWEQVVSEGTKNLLQQIADSPFGQERGFKTAKEVWKAWGSLEAELEDTVARERGIVPEEQAEEWDRIKEAVRIPTNEKAWGDSWPGLTGPSARFGGLTFNEFTPEVQQMAGALGMELLSGSSGQDLFNEIQRVLTDVDSVAFQIAKPAYDEYIGDRTVGKAAWEATLRTQAHNPNLHESWRTELSSFLQRAARAEERSFEGQLTMTEAQEIVDAYQRLRMTAPRSLQIDWEGAWEGRYQRVFGPLDWTPPEPPPAVDDEGNLMPNAYQPYIQRIVDGDTLIVSEHVGPRFFWMDLEGTPKMKSVRLLGVAARELGTEEGLIDRQRLVDFLTEARDNNEPIYLVRDPGTFGTNTDVYGRELAWLVVGDTPFYFPEELDRSVYEGGE